MDETLLCTCCGQTSDYLVIHACSFNIFILLFETLSGNKLYQI